MFSRRVQQRARKMVGAIIRPPAHLSVRPNTSIIVVGRLSVVLTLVIAWGYVLLGGLLALFADVFDMFDGAMARVRNASTTFGAFLNSMLDRYSESIILFGLHSNTLQRPGPQDALWPALYERNWMITFGFTAVVGSLLGSYSKACAEGLRIECKTGRRARPERVIILAIGLLSNTGIRAWFGPAHRPLARHCCGAYKRGFMQHFCDGSCA